MPVKRRAEKRRSFDKLKLEDLMYGPGTCLFNGCGYLARYGDGIFREKSPEIQAAILDDMRADWEIHYRAVLQAWADRDEHQIWCGENHYGNPSEPWAQTQFGMPG